MSLCPPIGLLSVADTYISVVGGWEGFSPSSSHPAYGLLLLSGGCDGVSAERCDHDDIATRVLEVVACGVSEGKEEHAGSGGIFCGDIDLAEFAQHGHTLLESVVVLVEHRKGRIEVYMCVECVCVWCGVWRRWKSTSVEQQQ